MATRLPEAERAAEGEGPNDGESRPTVGLKAAKRQKAAKAALPAMRRGEAPRRDRSGEAGTAAHGNGGSGNGDARLMERIVERDNVVKALKRVEQNKGSPGIDGMTVEDLRPYLRANWTQLREQLLAGSHQPRPVRKHDIPKSDGGVRTLGIPTVLDRFIQQAILQVLQPMFDPTFSNGSFGFRPGRSAHQAVTMAQHYIQAGKTWVVDVDLEKFFDRVNHDVLMSRLARRISDKRLLRLVRAYLNAGIMVNGVVMPREEGTPQGGPLSPLLANVLLDEVDKELEKRGLAFVRYADDCNVYVSSERAANDAMETLKRLFAKLRLRINESKSAVDRPLNRRFLGYGFFLYRGEVRLAVSDKALTKMMDRTREMTGRSRGRSLAFVATELRSYLVGWRNYFRLAQTPSIFKDLDRWIRRRLRMLVLKQWKRGVVAYRELRRLGVSDDKARFAATDIRRLWRKSRAYIHIGLTNAYFDGLGVPRLAS